MHNITLKDCNLNKLRFDKYNKLYKVLKLYIILDQHAIICFNQFCLHMFTEQEAC